MSNAVFQLVNDQELPEIVIFSETTQKSRIAIDNLLTPLGYTARIKPEGRVRVAVFDNIDSSNVIYTKKDQRFTSIIYSLNTQNIMVTGVHLDSPASYPDVDDRYFCAGAQYKLIESIEETFNVKKSIIIGDFNMNPFDKGMVSELSFKATHCKKTAQITKGNKRYFYNPSWGAFSNDLTLDDGKPPGTIHYVPFNKETYVDYWHIFDQVLVRSELFSEYTNSFEVITKTSTINLLNNEFIPDRERYSDHLPIKYKIKI